MTKMYKVKLTREAMHGISEFISLITKEVSNGKAIDDSDKLHLSVLVEVMEIINRRLCDVKKDYKVSFKPAQAIALKMLSPGPDTSFIGNLFHQISNEVHRLYI